MVFCHAEWWGRTQMQGGTQTCRNKGFILEKSPGHRKGTHIIGARTRQRLDTKQEPKYTEPNDTQVDTMKQTRQTTERGR